MRMAYAAIKVGIGEAGSHAIGGRRFMTGVTRQGASGQCALLHR